VGTNKKLQFKSGYDTHLALLKYKNGNVAFTIPITMVQQNLGYEDSRPALFKDDTAYSYIYFDEIESIPGFYKIGYNITIGTETKTIIDITYLEDDDIWAIKTLKFTSYTDNNVKYIYNRKPYNVYELDIPEEEFVAGNEYFVELSAERTTALNPDDNKSILFKSIPLVVENEFEDAVDIKYWNNRNNDVYWQSGILFQYTVGLDFRVSTGEIENTAVGTDSSTYLEKSYAREKFKFKFEPMTLELGRKMVIILSQFHVTVNNTRYVFDEVELESIGEYTNNYVVTATGYKADSQDYFIEEFGGYVGGLHGTEAGMTLVHRECKRIINPESRFINVVFDEPFGYVPQGVANLKVYRMVQQGNIWVQQDVLFGHSSENWLTATGFSLEISIFEEFWGSAIIEYCFH
jgi:hypothetical protein